MAGRPPRYDEQQTVGALPATPRASAPDAYGRALSGLGRLGMDMAADELAQNERDRVGIARNERELQARRITDQQQYEDRRARVDAHVALADAQGELDKVVADAKAATTGDPSGFTPRIDKAFADVSGRVLRATPNQLANDYLRSGFANLRQHYLAGALAWEAGAATKYDRKRVGDTREALAPGVLADDGLYESRLAQALAQIDASRMDPDVKEAERDATRQFFATTAATGFAERNPAAALALTDKRLGMTTSGAAPAGLSPALQKAWQAATPGERFAIEWTAKEPGASAQAIAGKPRIENADGSFSTERTMTVERGGRHYVVPTISNGQQLSQAEAEAAFRAGTLEPVGSFSNAALAEQYARARSNAIGAIYANRDRIGAPAGPATVQPYVDGAQATSEGGKTGVAWMDALTPAQVQAVRSKALAEQRRGVAEKQHVVRALEQDSAEAAKNGEVRPTASRAAYIEAYGEEGAALHERAQRFPAMGSRVASLRGMTPEQFATFMDRPRPGADAKPGAYHDDDAERDFEARAFAQIQQQREKDWIVAAGTESIAQVNPLDWKDQAAFAREISNRQGIALKRPQYVPGSREFSGVFTQGEAKVMRDTFTRLDPYAVADTLRVMRTSITDPGVYRASVQQVAPDSVATLVAANLASKDDPRGTAVATSIIAGERILNPSRDQRKEDGKPRNPTPLPPDFDQLYAKAMGDALAYNPGAADQGRQAVAAHYVASASNAGKLGKDAADPELVKASIAAVVGAPVEYGGLGKVIGPWGMEASTARERLNRAYADALERGDIPRTGPYASLSRVRLVNRPAAEGQYVIAVGDGFLKRKDGQVIVLDINPPTFPRGLVDQVPR